MIRSSSSSKSDLYFEYDAMGNRICKIVKPRAGHGILNQDQWTYTYYLRDAGGNILANYTRDFNTPTTTYNESYTLTENDLYGSSRVGVRSVSELQANVRWTYGSTNADGTYVGTSPTKSSTAAPTNSFVHELKRKAYEMVNHLGNVLVTVSDARTANNSGSTVTGFNALVITATDYYAFGSPMVKRVKAGDYRYGFNGKENDPEANSTGEGTQDYGMRIYNPSLGRFLSVDPLTKGYPWYTPYQFAGNKPIIAIDLDGMEEFVTTTQDLGGGQTKPLITITATYGLITSGPNAVSSVNLNTVNAGLDEKYGGIHQVTTDLTAEEAASMGLGSTAGSYSFNVQFKITVVDAGDGSTFNTDGLNNQNAGIIQMGQPGDPVFSDDALDCNGATVDVQALAVTDSNPMLGPSGEPGTNAKVINLNPVYFNGVDVDKRAIMVNNYLKGPCPGPNASVTDYRNNDGSIIGHEIGHDLGIHQEEGTGATTVDNRNENGKVTQQDIQSIIKNASAIGVKAKTPAAAPAPNPNNKTTNDLHNEKDSLFNKHYCRDNLMHFLDQDQKCAIDSSYSNY